jgi:hypothetical protein
MTSLADLLDPDQWMTSGKNLTDFPWPNGNNEREAMKHSFEPASLECACGAVVKARDGGARPARG